ncbi:MAG: flagellar biosynthesis protein FlgJ [Geobacter sp.]|nr:flagellar biosynthesis protein FlgJ [Geobacter sp.]
MMNTNLQITPDHLLQEQKAEQLGRQAVSRGKQLNEAERSKLKKISQDFEALFIGMMLKSMRDTVPEDKLTGGGKAEETYRYLLDQEYATQAARRGGANSIAAMVEKELLKQYAVPVKKLDGTGI